MPVTKTRLCRLDDIDSSTRRMVSAALERLISLAGTEITQRVYVTEQRELCRATAADSIRRRGAITDFGRTLEGRRRDFRRCIRSSRRFHLRLWALSMTKNGNSISHRLKKDQPPLPRTNIHLDVI